MKKIYSVILSLVMVFTFLGVVSDTVKADEATLSDLKVQSQSAAGELTDVTLTPAFSPEITEYNATVKNDTIKLVLTPTTTEADAYYELDWVAMDVGDNQSFVYVTANDGTKMTYTIYTKRLTAEEEATYVPEEESGTDGGEGQEEKTTVKVDGVKMTISSDFSEADIPEGFSETEYTYKKKEYKAIKGDVKDIVALWLEPAASDSEEEDGDSEESDAAGFYIYDEKEKSFYSMDNIYVKSRMYTVVKMAEPDDVLNNYESRKVTIVDEEVDAWVLDEENSLYLVYAMNWEGETNLYCYDDVEKCFQRYIVANTASEQIEAANDSINTLQKKNNELVKKYNDSNGTKWKIIAVLLVIVVILFFVSLNLFLKIRTNALAGYERADQPKEKASKKKKAVEDEGLDIYDDDDEDDDELFKLVEEDDFVIVDDNTETKDSDVKEEKKDFDIATDEIDISEQIIKEMKAESLSEVVPEKGNDEEEDDDGFTFI